MPAESDDAPTILPSPGKTPDGMTADDFLQMRGLPRRTELVDGSLVIPTVQTKWHARVKDLLQDELDEQTSRGMRADRGMTVRIADRDCLEPDIVLVTEDAYHRWEPDNHYLPEDVVLAVEVVSPESENRDRVIKPPKYAAAGIAHFWRVEDARPVVVHVHGLDSLTSTYALTGVHRERLRLTTPFGIDIDLTAVWDRRHRRSGPR
jgi:Uma2 family endonuclease